MPTVIKKLDANSYQLKDQVVAINRVTKVVKGGKNLSFAALVVVGDPSAAVVGHGAGKAKEVPQAIRKAIEAAKKNLIKVNLTQTSIPHLVLGNDLGGRAECIDQVDWNDESAQRDQGHIRRAEKLEEPRKRCGDARQDATRDLGLEEAVSKGIIDDNEETESSCRKDTPQVGSFGHLRPGQTEAGGQGIGIYAVEPGN
jgi:hypothetical protein